MTAPGGLGPDILSVLQQLRSRIRRYVLLEGLAVVLCLAGLAFWLSVLLDYGFELPQGARRVLVVLTVTALVLAFLWFVVLRMVRAFRDRALALVLERRFPELNERLITAVDLAGSEQRDTPATASMLQQTAREASELLRKLNLGEVFNSRPLLRAAGLALALLLSMGGFAWAGGEVFQTWYRRNLLFNNERYRRETELNLAVLADPGERRMPFENGVYKHPRGADLNLLAEVAEGKLVPREVNYRYRALESSGAGDGYMTRVGDRAFRQKLAGLKDSIRLDVRGGDFRTLEPLRVLVVDPPAIDRVTLDCLYPAYTGMNEPAEPGEPPLRDRVEVQGAQVSIPAGTDFGLEARFNKPLVEVRLQTEFAELRLTSDASEIRWLGADGKPAAEAVAFPLATPALAADGLSLRLPCVLGTTPEPARTDAAGRPLVPLPLPADAPLRLWLHDRDGIVSAEPARLTITAIPDQHPAVDVRLKGIGTSITRQATIPVAGQIRDAAEGSQLYGVVDDYGVADVRFEYRVEGGAAAPTEAFQSRAFETPAGGRPQVEVAERFPVLDLDLTVGQKLVLKVVASDADNLTGPHQASGTPWTFQIVSDDELIALVALKELNIRRRFEQILEELRNTRKDLLLHRTRLEEAQVLRGRDAATRTAADAEKLAVLETGALTSVERATSGARKNHNELQSIEEEFRDVRDELANNAIPDVRPMLERMDDGILRPLRQVNADDFNAIDDLLVKGRDQLETQENPLGTLELTTDQLGATITKLEGVLAQMLKNEDYNKVLEMLRSVIRGQEELKKQTELERKKKLIEGLK